MFILQSNTSFLSIQFAECFSSGQKCIFGAKTFLKRCVFPCTVWLPPGVFGVVCIVGASMFALFVCKLVLPAWPHTSWGFPCSYWNHWLNSTGTPASYDSYTERNERDKWVKQSRPSWAYDTFIFIWLWHHIACTSHDEPTHWPPVFSKKKERKEDTVYYTIKKKATPNNKNGW